MAVLLLSLFHSFFLFFCMYIHPHEVRVYSLECWNFDTCTCVHAHVHCVLSLSLYMYVFEKRSRQLLMLYIVEVEGRFVARAHGLLALARWTSRSCPVMFRPVRWCKLAGCVLCIALVALLLESYETSSRGRHVDNVEARVDVLGQWSDRIHHWTKTGSLQALKDASKVESQLKSETNALGERADYQELRTATSRKPAPGLARNSVNDITGRKLSSNDTVGNASAQRGGAPSIGDLPECTVKSPYTGGGGGASDDELSAVYHNLDRCLFAANLTQLFKTTGMLYSVARNNARRFLSTVRGVVPAEFNSEYSAPCWETVFEMRYCRMLSNTYNFPLRSIEGRLGPLPYRYFTYAIRKPLVEAMERRYSGGISSSLVCLPKVFLAGFPKCGSTYIYCLLQKLTGLVDTQHASHQLDKEPRWWVSGGPHSNHQFPHSAVELTLYLINFIASAEAELDLGFSLPVDGSPNLLFQWPRYSHMEGITNYCLVPAVLPQVLPNAKYIVVLRNPVDMLYSAFWFSFSTYNVKLNRDKQLQGPGAFHNKAMEKIAIFKNCSNFLPIDKCMEELCPKVAGQSGMPNPYGRVRLEAGFYYLYIRRWLSVVPRKQFFVFTIEELQENASLSRMANKLSDFLGLGLHVHSDDALRNTQDSTGCDNVQSQYDYHHDPLLQMRDDTRELLNNFFMPYNMELAKLLEDDKFLWLGNKS